MVKDVWSCCFNRTNVELKYRQQPSRGLLLFGFNRTNVELKCNNVNQIPLAVSSFNRTNVELKYMYRVNQWSTFPALIVLM